MTHVTSPPSVRDDSLHLRTLIVHRFGRVTSTHTSGAVQYEHLYQSSRWVLAGCRPQVFCLMSLCLLLDQHRLFRKFSMSEDSGLTLNFCVDLHNISISFGVLYLRSLCSGYSEGSINTPLLKSLPMRDLSARVCWGYHLWSCWTVLVPRRNPSHVPSCTTFVPDQYYIKIVASTVRTDQNAIVTRR